MIKEIRIKNFGPIREQLTIDFSMHGSVKGTPFIEINNEKISKVSGIFGKNGAGKTAILDSINILKSIIQKGTIEFALFRNPFNNQIGVLKNIYEKDNNVHIGVTLYVQNTTFFYDISFNENGITNETLLFSDSNPKKKTEIFNRNKINNMTMFYTSTLALDIKNNQKYRKEINNFVSKWKNINVFPVYLHEFQFYFNWAFATIENAISKNKIKNCKNLKEYQEKILNPFLKIADINFEKYNIQKNINQQGGQIVSNYIITPVIERKKVKGNKIAEITLSSGTIEYILILSLILATQIFEGVLLIDEFSSHKHIELTNVLINIFPKLKNNKAQLIFNSNQASLIERLKAEQLIFLDNKNGLGSELWKPKKADTHNRSLYKAYVEGRLWGSPNVDQDQLFNAIECLNGN